MARSSSPTIANHRRISKEARQPLELDRLRAEWTRLGDIDPMWAVLTDRDKRGGRWNVDEFLASGRVEASELQRTLRSLGVTDLGTTALDFGCGIGRVTQALGAFYEQVWGLYALK